ncbi:MAG: hypothetical protein BGN87_23280 [Rhizobiales bacterium 65-79]|nr:MFS transporter [Hyphomicrobiales bacterium]OJU01377.1 MAG: hypothetical protein BGN87_23280 [Rhizobiales bacterium 65-79]
MATAFQLTEALNKSKLTKRHISFYLIMIFCHFFDGFDIQTLGFALPGIIKDFALSPKQAGFLASSVFIGMLFGGIIVGTIADRIGRKYAIIFAASVYGAMSLAAAFATSYDSILVIRILQGFGLGAEVPLVFTYLSEFLPAKHRGFLIASIIAFWQAASFVTALLAIYIVPAFTWRGMFVAGAIPVAVLLVLLARLPESVRFLLLKGRNREAEKIVGDFSDVPAHTLPATNSSPVAQQASLSELATSGYLRATLGLWIMQFCGGAVFIGLLVWLPSIFVKMGFSLVHSFVFTAAITASGAVGNVIGGYSIDLVGRRATLAAAFIIGGILTFFWGFASSGTAIVLIGCVTAFFAFGAAGGPLFAYTSEIYPTRFRATGTGWAAAWQRVGGIVAPIALSSVLASGANNSTFFLILAVTLLAGGVSMLFLGYETKGRSLEQIQLDLSGKAA